jgi:hypothetical protein
MVGRCGRLKGVLQGLCLVGFQQENVVSERLLAEGVHHERTGCGRWCVEVRQIGAWQTCECGHRNDIHVPPFAGTAGTDSFDRYPDFPQDIL